MDARLCLQSGMHRNHPSSLWSSGHPQRAQKVNHALLQSNHPQRAQKVNHALLQSNRERYGSRIVVVRAKIEACKCVYRKRRKDGWREYFYFLYGVHDSMSTSVDLRGRTSTGCGLRTRGTVQPKRCGLWHLTIYFSFWNQTKNSRFATMCSAGVPVWGK